MPQGGDPLEAGEILLRRILNKDDLYIPGEEKPSYAAFKPNSWDTTGLSLSRAKSEQSPTFLDPVQFAMRGGNLAGYYVAWLRYSDLRVHEIEVVPKPESDDPGHCEIPALNYLSRKETAAIEMTRTLAALTFCVTGPYIKTDPNPEA